MEFLHQNRVIYRDLKPKNINLITGLRTDFRLWTKRESFLKDPTVSDWRVWRGPLGIWHQKLPAATTTPFGRYLQLWHPFMGNMHPPNGICGSCSLFFSAVSIGRSPSNPKKIKGLKISCRPGAPSRGSSILCCHQDQLEVVQTAIVWTYVAFAFTLF
jgi:hypothetical protein